MRIHYNRRMSYTLQLAIGSCSRYQNQNGELLSASHVYLAASCGQGVIKEAVLQCDEYVFITARVNGMNQYTPVQPF